MKTFQKIADITCKMFFLSGRCQLESDEKNRDKMMDKIIKLNEEIDHLVSSNWH